MKTVTITTWRDGDWWVATSDDIEGFATQVRRLDQLPEAARDIAGLADDVDDADQCTFVINVDEDLDRPAAHARELVAASDAARRDATKALRDAAHTFARQGLTVRDIGTLLNVSYQHAQKLTSSAASD